MDRRGSGEGKRRCLDDVPARGVTRRPGNDILCDVALLPKDSVVRWLGRLRPITAVPTLSKALGGAMLDMIFDQIAALCAWQ